MLKIIELKKKKEKGILYSNNAWQIKSGIEQKKTFENKKQNLAFNIWLEDINVFISWTERSAYLYIKE